MYWEFFTVFQNFYLFIPRFLAVVQGSAGPVGKQWLCVVITTEEFCDTLRRESIAR
jgi:hypothetical protein